MFLVLYSLWVKLFELHKLNFISFLDVRGKFFSKKDGKLKYKKIEKWKISKKDQFYTLNNNLWIFIKKLNIIKKLLFLFKKK